MRDETQYKKIYRTVETADGKKSYDIFVRQGSHTTVSTIQSEKIAEGEERTLSVFLREEDGKVTLEVWTGFVGDALKKYERQFMTEVDYDAGTLLMNESYEGCMNVYNHTPQIAEISERIVGFAKLQMKMKQKTL
jgi:hypothetical protein